MEMTSYYDRRQSTQCYPSTPAKVHLATPETFCQRKRLPVIFSLL